jgi:predicted RNA-binding protein with PUA domain
MASILLRAYVDESGTHDTSDYTLVAGWVGHAERWDTFENKWKILLARYGIPYIHCKDLRQGTKLFRDKRVWPPDRFVPWEATY